MPLLEGNAESFEQLAGYQEISARSASLDGATLSGARVSPSLFPLLSSIPQLGRLFMEEKARDGADGVVLLSHGVWTRRSDRMGTSSAPSSTSTASRIPSSGAHSRFPGHALTPTGVMAIRCKQFHLPDL